MNGIKHNIIFFSTIGIGLLVVSLIFFYRGFDELRLNIMFLAIQQLFVGLPAPDLSVFFILSHAPRFELYAYILSIAGIAILSLTILYLIKEEFDWHERWMRYCLVFLLISILFASIGLGIIAYKKQLLSIYILLTLALQQSGWLSYLFAPYKIIDVIILYSLSICAVIINFISIQKFTIY